MEILPLVTRPQHESEGPYCPLVVSAVPAGFPSPADDYIEGRLDLNSHLIKHPAATFFVRATGESMTGAGIHPGDILIVDRALEARNDSIIIAVLDGEMLVKRLKRHKEETYLLSEHEGYDPIHVTGNGRFSVWGVVTTVIHQV